MKNLLKITAICFFTLITTLYYSQSPILSVPPNYLEIDQGGVFFYDLPQPNPSLWNATTASIYSPYGGPVDILEWKDQAYDGRPALGGHNAMYDVDGNLLFFIIDNTIFNHEGWFIDKMGHETGNTSNLSGVPTLVGESQYVIIPHANDCNKYYILATFLRSDRYNEDIEGFDKRDFRYVLLDLSEYNVMTERMGVVKNPISGATNIGLGHVDLIENIFPANVNPDPDGFQQGEPKISGNLAALTPRTSDGRRFLYTFNGVSLFKFIVDNNGINLDMDPNNNVVDFSNPFGTTVYHKTHYFEGAFKPSNYAVSEMEVVALTNGGFRIAYPYVESIFDPSPSPKNDKVVIIDMDANGNYISGSDVILHFPRNSSGQTVSHYGVKGLEFNEDGSILYINKNIFFSNDESLYFYDFANPSLGSQVLNHSFGNSYSKSQIELALDGKIYLANGNGLGTINNPNDPYTTTVTSNSNAFNYNFTTTGYANNATFISDVGTEALTYTLPNQIDTEFWGDRFDLNCCELATGGAIDFTATVSQTWSPGNNPFGNANGAVYINGDLTIPSGVNITMNNMKFIFSETSQLNVQVGGRLTTYNTLLTSRACEGLMWQGVRVEGNPNLGPSPISNQGYFAMYQNSEIRNAYIGVTNYRTTANPSDLANPTPIMAFRGGKVIASNSVYRNNVRDVVLRTYNKLGSSYQFTNCEFLTDAAILDGSYPGFHATLIFVDRVRFHGCDFKNTTTGVYADDDRGSGIYSFNSLFEVSFRCNNAVLPGATCNKDRSTFSNLYRGVRASGGPFVTKTATVKYSDFDHVSLGVHYTNVDNSFCVNNNFTNIGPLTSGVTAGSTSTNGAYGLHLDHCTGYAVENNTFESTSYQNDTYGIIVVNSNNNGTIPDANVIYNNEFENLNYGIVGLLENVGISYEDDDDHFVKVGSGLQLRCNDFKNNLYNNDISWLRGGISPIQGNTNLNELPNNIFNSSSWDLANYNTEEILNSYKYQTAYLYYQNNNGFNIKPDELRINPLVENTFPSPRPGSFDLTTGCPVNRFDISRRPLLGGKLADGKSLLTASENLKNEIANADAEVLMLMAQRQSNSISVGDYKNAINDYAKLLNDDRLIDQLSLGLPSGILKNILEANAPLSNEVVEEINNAQMPKGIKNQLKALKISNGQTAANQQVLADAGYLEIKSKLLINEVIREYLSDSTIINGVDSATLLMEEYNKFYNKCRRVEVYVGKRDYVKAEIVLDSIRDLNNNQDDNLTNFCEFYGLMIEIAQIDETCGIIKTDSNYRQRVESFAEISTTDRTCLRANSLLMAFLDYDYNELFPDLTQYKSMYSIMVEEDEIYTPTKMLLVYPNPSSDIFNIMIDDENSTNGTIEVYDNVGKLIVSKQIYNSLGYVEMNQFPKGIYQVVVTSQDGNTYFDRIILK